MTDPAPLGRLAALDGLRGLAALVVLLHHALLILPAFAAPYYAVEPASATTVLWWLTYTPLHLLWGGTEAVLLFFILSGLVLTLAVNRDGFDWSAYFPSRLLRLYIPVIAATAIAAISIWLVPRTGDPSSQWVAGRPREYTIQGVFQDVILLDGPSGVVSPLWTLQWEVLFSLLLPVYVAVARKLSMSLQFVLSVALATLGVAIGNLALYSLPVFAIGVTMGLNWDAVCRFANSLTLRCGNIAWAAVTVIGLLLSSSYWILRWVSSGSGADWASRPLVLFGLLVLVVVAACWRPAIRLLSRRALQWAGLISFSLYLVHEPIVIATSYLLGPSRVAVALSVLISVLTAVLFYAAIERPAHLIARQVKARMSIATVSKE